MTYYDVLHVQHATGHDAVEIASMPYYDYQAQQWHDAGQDHAHMVGTNATDADSAPLRYCTAQWATCQTVTPDVRTLQPTDTTPDLICKECLWRAVPVLGRGAIFGMALHEHATGHATGHNTTTRLDRAERTTR